MGLTGPSKTIEVIPVEEPTPVKEEPAESPPEKEPVKVPEYEPA